MKRASLLARPQFEANSLGKGVPTGIEVMANDETITRWHHAPNHRFVAAYIVTVGTVEKAHLFNTPEKRTFLQQSLFNEAEAWNWRLQAWAIMTNHYHFVAQAPEEATTLRRLIQSLHSKTAIEINKQDGVEGR